MIVLKWIINIFDWLFKAVNIFYLQLPIYVIVGLFKTRKFKKAKKQHKYAIMVAARNEAAVIGNLLESIKAQDYPREHIKVFVVADNCTDNTAEVARENGAVCYERQNSEHCTKGYALQFLVEQIRRDYKIESFDGYFVFDADNLLKEDYISRMNESFDAGEKIVTSYRNTKNLDDNWISASYAIHWLRTARTEHRARSVFHLASRIQGTGFLFANEIIENGWSYVRLTEDRSFCADSVVKGYKISYNHEAVFYDEQPTDIKIAMRQRIRWAKGNLQSFGESGGRLFLHIFHRRSPKGKIQKSVFSRIADSLHYRFMSFDMLTVTFPYPLISVIKRLVVNALSIALLLNYGAAEGPSYLPAVLGNILNLLSDESGSGALLAGLLTFLTVGLIQLVITWFCSMCLAIFIFITERKRIVKIKWYRKIWYCFTFPLFDIIGEIVAVIALFTKPEWKPIPHTSKVKIGELSPGKKARKDKEKKPAISGK